MSPLAPTNLASGTSLLSDIYAWYQQNRFLVLLVLIAMLLCIHPLAETRPDLGILFGLAVTGMLLLQIMTLAQSRLERSIGIALAVPEMLFIMLKYQLMATPLELAASEWAAILFIPFHTYAIWIIYRYLFNQSRITVDEVRGCICVFMLIGATWSAVYYAWELFFPGSWVAAQHPGVTLTWFDMLYYSFATLSSLGMGDITPIHPIARSLTILECINGLFYIAITVARLVTQFMNHELSGDKDTSHG